MWIDTRWDKPKSSRTLPLPEPSAAIERAKATHTVREFLSACIIPWAFEIKDDAMIRVQWQDLSYALSETKDLYAVRVTMRPDLTVVEEDFRESWPDLWRPV